MFKYLSIIILALSLAGFIFLAKTGETNIVSYYSGDAIAFNNNLYVGSANSGFLEIFQLDGSELNRLVQIKAYDNRYSKYEDFSDLAFSIENNKLFIYAISNYSLYKYELKNNDLHLVNVSTNTYWEWYTRVEKQGNNIVTASAKGIKVFNSNLQIIDSHNYTNTNKPYNLSFSQSRFIVNLDNEDQKLKVYDKEQRKEVTQVALNFKYKDGNRQAYQDNFGYIYLVDDYYAKKYDLSGNLLAHYEHSGHQGFDVAASLHTDYIYFSNGVGIVKLNKDMKVNDYQWTYNLGGEGSWAMGLKTVYLNGDKVVIFNNANILVLDENLNKLALIESTTMDERKYPSENLYLNLDKNRANANATVMVSGGGFIANEELNILFNQKKVAETTANNLGRFDKIITIPEIKASVYDIKVEGLNSNLHYSISFKLE